MFYRLFITSFLLFLAACAPVDILNSTVPHDGYHIKSDLAYGSLPQQKLDLYLPKHIDTSTPVVVFFHGGGWNSGNRKEYLFAAAGLVSMGYIVAVPDYRLYPEVKYPTFLEDCAKATVWIYNHIADYGGNSENLYLMGHSAGAYNVAMLALNPSYLERAGGHAAWIQGAIGLAGPYDFLPLTDPDVAVIFASEKNLPATQPVTYVHANAPPMLLLTGNEDITVKPQNSRSLSQKLQALGNTAIYKEYDGMAHYGIVLGLSDGILGNNALRQDIKAFIEKQ